MLRWASGLAPACLVVLLSRPSFAEEGGTDARFRLSWARGDGAESCVDQRALAGAVRLRLGREPFADDAESGIEGTILRDGSTFRANLRVRDARGTEVGRRDLELETGDCSKLTDALVLAVALTIDPNAPASGEASPVDDHPAAEAPAVTPRSDTEEHAVANAARPAPQASDATAQRGAPCPACAPKKTRELRLALRGLVGGGLLPGIAPGVSVTGFAGTREFTGTLGLSWFPETSTADGEFSFGSSSVSAGACWEPLAAARFLAGACADFAVGALHAVVWELAPVEPGDHAFVAAELGPYVGVELGLGLRVELGAFAALPLLRPNFLVQGTNERAFKSEALGIVGFLGLGLGTPDER
ncbi:MAG TPA: hypothetical protein VGK73_24190 [Polyangiaceae bacterium]